MTSRLLVFLPRSPGQKEFITGWNGIESMAIFVISFFSLSLFTVVKFWTLWKLWQRSVHALPHSYVCLEQCRSFWGNTVQVFLGSTVLCRSFWVVQVFLGSTGLFGKYRVFGGNTTVWCGLYKWSSVFKKGCNILLKLSCLVLIKYFWIKIVFLFRVYFDK